MFKFDLTDQRRLAVAAAITVIALPSLWLTSRNEEAGVPNVATAGVAISPETGSVSTVGLGLGDPMGSPGAAYLDGPPAGSSPAVINIAIPTESPGTHPHAQVPASGSSAGKCSSAFSSGSVASNSRADRLPG